jgi:hypothetical protein
MHNTMRIGEARQARPNGAFAWLELPRCHLAAATETRIEGICEYAGFCHRRVIEYDQGTRTIIILDTIQGPAVQARLEQTWHPGVSVRRESSGGFRLGDRASLTFPPGSDVAFSHGGEYGWIASAYGTKSEADFIRRTHEGILPITLETAITVS